MKFLITLAICLGVATVSAAPQRLFQSENEFRQSSETSHTELQQQTNFRPGAILNQFTGAIGGVVSAPAVLVALAFYPLACAIREGGCRRSANFDGMIHFNLTSINGDVEQLAEQLRDDGEVDVTDFEEYKPLQYAFENHNAKIVKMFLENGINAEGETLNDEDKTLKIILKSDKQMTNEMVR